MLTLTIVALVIAGLGYIACVVTAAVGGASDYMGYETWGNTRCEHLYYRYFAPVSLVALVVAFVGMVIAVS